MVGKKLKNREKQKSENEEKGQDLKDQLVRALADYDNLRKRVEVEKEVWTKVIGARVIAKFLPILDNLESAQIHLKDQGLAISISEFKKALNEEGLEEIKPEIGSIFDEKIMEVIEVVEGEYKNTIAELILSGWKYVDDTIVRHAKVKVFGVNN